MNGLENGLIITDKNGLEKNIQVKIRAFLCDSPARALIKGVCNFNGKNGCLKCTVLGEYSHRSHTVIFTRVGCPKRNNEDFRLKKYGLHHKSDSPLLQLPIDMVEDFPVSDSLHLIDLGIMKRLLTGWRDGNFGTYVTKWRARDIETVSQFLLGCTLPKEIHRKMRALNVLAYWKGSEFRCFLYYLSFIVLKDVLCGEAYHHFLAFFCAITICSNEEHFMFLRLAEQLLFFFLEHFRDLYGEECMTSNIHNLSHIIDEVQKFGKLQNFNTYPFENKLNQIKQLIRQGNSPLAQIAKRLNEKNIIEIEMISGIQKTIPYIKVCRNRGSTLT
ncbi:uncharacterized protein LOC134663368 [Cydia fagiglandana]|uniref:uncharacterized protein LOC134663368 n=1 Tax=Cydia fagiglandana TaxID=1458189 RepID=UPI002FEE1740